MSVTDVLMQQAMLDNQNQPDPAVAMGIGATGGAALGAIGGMPLHATGNVINRALGRGGQIRPGFRAAGGLVGAIAGGALGAGLANMMKESSPAGNMLAKIQAQQGQLSAMDKMQLEAVLRDIYGNM